MISLIVAAWAPWQTPAPEFVERWAIERSLTAPMSVTCDPMRGAVFIATAKGIALANVDGRLVNPRWVQGLEAPRGLSIGDGKLFYVVGGDLAAVDAVTGKPLGRWRTPARELTDSAVDAAGLAFACDRNANRVYALREGEAALYASGDFLHQPSALWLEETQLMIACWGGPVEKGAVRSLPLTPNAVTSLWSNPIGALSGISADGDFGYFVCDYKNGVIYRVTPEGQALALIRLEAGVADIFYLAGRKLLLVAHAARNALLAFQAP